MPLRRLAVALLLPLACSERSSVDGRGGGAGQTGATPSGGSGSSSGGAGASGSGAAGQAGASLGGSAGGGASGSPALGGGCGGLGGAAVVATYAPKRFALGDDPSSDVECTAVSNPERGFRNTADLRVVNDFSQRREQGFTTVYGGVLLDDYLASDLDQALLDVLQSNFDAARAAGVKLLPRFYHQADLSPGATDAALEVALAHVEQLGPLLEANADVIAALHAGFVGAWGEWHGSTTGLDQEAPREQILAALLEALPASRSVLLRRPSFKSLAYGGPLTESSAWNGSELARLGHLNDCFLASDDDLGTYQLEGEKDYALADSAFTAVDGETCAVNPPRSQCAAALAELALHHWSTLNVDYQQDVLNGWREEGCFESIACRLGYRFVLLGHRSPAAARRGTPFSLAVSLANDGYAAPYNARPLRLALRGPEQRAIDVQVDMRRIAPDSEVELCLEVVLPAELEPGEYQLGLAMPDAAPALAADERYAVRIANDVIWEDGVNWLDAHVTVSE